MNFKASFHSHVTHTTGSRVAEGIVMMPKSRISVTRVLGSINIILYQEKKVTVIHYMQRVLSIQTFSGISFQFQTLDIYFLPFLFLKCLARPFFLTFVMSLDTIALGEIS